MLPYDIPNTKFKERNSGQCLNKDKNLFGERIQHQSNLFCKY